MLYFIRHGETSHNKKNLLQGRSNQPLNESGRIQAEDAGKAFAARGIVFDKIYSSPLIRAVETAEIISRTTTDAPVEIVTDERLLEMDYGPYEGADLTDMVPELKRFIFDLTNVPAPEGMEQLPEVVSRVGGFLEEILEEAREKNVLISTHAIAMKGGLEYLTPESKGSYWSKYLPNCGVYVSETGEDGYSVPVEWDTE